MFKSTASKGAARVRGRSGGQPMRNRLGQRQRLQRQGSRGQNVQRAIFVVRLEQPVQRQQTGQKRAKPKDHPVQSEPACRRPAPRRRAPARKRSERRPSARPKPAACADRQGTRSRNAKPDHRKASSNSCACCLVGLELRQVQRLGLQPQVDVGGDDCRATPGPDGPAPRLRTSRQPRASSDTVGSSISQIRRGRSRTCGPVPTGASGLPKAIARAVWQGLQVKRLKRRSNVRL